MRNILAVVLIATLSACVVVAPSSRPVTIEDGSAVDLRTEYRAAELIWYTVQKRGCMQTDRIVPTIVEKSPEFEFASGHVVRGRVTERWIANGCGSTYPFIVEFSADGKGGTDISTKPEAAK